VKEVITIEQDTFLALKPGDVVLWGGYCLRTVIEGATWPSGAIVISKLRNSWTGRAYTVCFYHDVKTKIIATGKRVRTVVSKVELARLEYLGFNVRRELVRELRERKATKLRMGRELCERVFKLPKAI
jgi:hypothetical protein